MSTKENTFDGVGCNKVIGYEISKRVRKGRGESVIKYESKFGGVAKIPKQM